MDQIHKVSGDHVRADRKPNTAIDTSSGRSRRNKKNVDAAIIVLHHQAAHVAII
jgi:hypothetical protein